MTLRNLGKSGLRVSLVGLGCNNFGGRMDLESSTKVIHKAIDAGITLFDTADAYGNQGGSETVLGQVLGERRKDIVPISPCLPEQCTWTGLAPGPCGSSFPWLSYEACWRADDGRFVDLFRVHVQR
jgi:diketogulonate reductase-like aldo/keto reductase